MRLVTGPPGSGKTSFCLDILRKSLETSRLLVPTATMAEHLRNQLAREGLVFRPSVVSTFSKFLEPYTGSLEEVSPAALEVIVDGVLQKDVSGRYARVRDFAGFRRSLASAIEEFATSGGTAEMLGLTDPEFAAVYRAVTAEVKRRGWHFRGVRLQAAAEKLRAEAAMPRLLLTGFYSFTKLELVVLKSLAEVSELTVTLPQWAGSERAIAELKAFARETVEFGAVTPLSDRIVTPAATIDAEVNEIARRVHAERQKGRPYREMGVILRSEEPYAAPLRTAFERFAIPARFYFSDALSEHPTIRFLIAIVEAVISNWEHEATLAALRLPGSPMEHRGDWFDFAIRECLPNCGLAKLQDLVKNAPQVSAFLESLEKLTPWTGSSARPQTWSLRFKSLTGLYAFPEITDELPHERAYLWREAGNALKHWPAAVDEAAKIFDAAELISCAEFFGVLRLVLSSMQLRTPDHRRDVVHVIDVFEARQWKLPVVFVCGLIEKQFPKYHSENPILGDEVRRRLQRSGVDLRTSVERQADERFLFDLLLTRATARIVFTYPQLNAKYDANLPSFLLERAKPYREERSADVRPQPLRPRAHEPLPSIYEDDLRAQLDRKHRTLSATSVETYLQCPYQFFAQNTLNLKEPPDSPFDRLNLMVQGTIVHAVLERCYRDGRAVEPVFNEVWEEVCQQEHIPPGYRTETIRLELLQNLELFAAEAPIERGVESRFEERFELDLGQCKVKGRIDRIEIDEHGRAILFDYKYRVKTGIERSKKGHAERTHVQGGLYLAAVPTLGPWNPVGMVYTGLKREIAFQGWILAPHYERIRQSCQPDELRQVINDARELTVQVATDLLGGRIAPEPADEKRCERCTYTNICRVDIAAMKRAVASGGSANAAQ